MNKLWLRERFDLLILDLMRPVERRSFGACAGLRGGNDPSRVMILPPRTPPPPQKRQGTSIGLGLEMGADAYLPKPSTRGSCTHQSGYSAARRRRETARRAIAGRRSVASAIVRAGPAPHADSVTGETVLHWTTGSCVAEGLRTLSPGPMFRAR